MRFYFHIRQGNELIEDPDGSEFVDLAAAREDARQAARELMAEALLKGEPLDGRTFEIRDAGRSLLATVPFEEALPQR